MVWRTTPDHRPLHQAGGRLPASPEMLENEAAQRWSSLSRPIDDAGERQFPMHQPRREKVFLPEVSRHP